MKLVREIELNYSLPAGVTCKAGIYLDSDFRTEMLVINIYDTRLESYKKSSDPIETGDCYTISFNRARIPEDQIDWLALVLMDDLFNAVQAAQRNLRTRYHQRREEAERVMKY